MSSPRFEIGYGDQYAANSFQQFYLDNDHPAREVLLKHFDLLDGDLYIEESDDSIVEMIILNKDGLYRYIQFESPVRGSGYED